MGSARYGRRWKPGPFWRGEGFTPLSDEYAREEFTHCLPPPEKEFLLHLNMIAWRKRTLVIRVAIPFLIKATKLPQRTIERYLSPSGRLRRLKFIRLHVRDNKRGNEYFIEPVYLWSSEWHELEHIGLSMLVQSRQSGGACDESNGDLGTENRQSGGTVDSENGSPANLAGESRQSGGACAESAGTESRQFGVDLRSDLFSRYELLFPGASGGRKKRKKVRRRSAAAMDETSRLNAIAQLRAQATRDGQKAGN